MAPTASLALSSGERDANTQSVLNNMDELLGRLRHINAVPTRERKS
jgi:hypothetical protein